MDHLRFFLEPKSRRIRSIQAEIQKRAGQLVPRRLDDLSRIRFDMVESLFQDASFLGRVVLDETQVGWFQVERRFLVGPSMALYGGIVLCDGTLIELMAFKKQKDVLQAAVGGGLDRFELHGLEAGFELGPQAELRWNHGPLPRAFRAPWLGATDWYLPESVEFLMGKANLEVHEVSPFVLLRGWAWYLYTCRQTQG